MFLKVQAFRKQKLFNLTSMALTMFLKKKLIFISIFFCLKLPGGSDGKASAYNVEDPGSVPRSGRSGEGTGNPLQYSCLENPMVGGACGLQSMGLQRVGRN